MHGFLNIDKPAGMTSFDVIRKIRQLFPRKTKIGHLGTLDPMASGVLPVALGKATRIIPYIEDDRKTYIAQLTLGGISDTQDAWGEISYTDKKDFKEEDLQAILKEYTGKIKQIPPMYSAVHHQGKRLYELAREGITVTREEREIIVYSLQLLDIDLKQLLPLIKIKVDCSRGTYVRTLCHDIGNKLGTGAFLSSLIRTRSGAFNIEQASSLEQFLKDKQCIYTHILPLDYPLAAIPAINFDSWQDINDIMNGKAVVINDTLMPDSLIRLYSPNGDLAALARHSYIDGKIMAKPERVFK